MTKHWAIRLFLCGLLLLCVTLSANAATPERRIALVIGIGAYQHAPPLANPVNDARAIGESLRRLEFDVRETYDPDYRALSSEIRSFGVRAAGADVAVVYYAGHGVQVDSENYLIPPDARLERERDLLYEAIPVERLLGEVAQTTKIGIVLLDSCRNNPFVERVARSINLAGRAVATTPGMARVDNVPRNTMVVMAAKAGQVAEDGQEHSPFAAAMLAHFQIPGLELGLFFRSVRDMVLRATGNRQEPYVFSSMGADPFYFYPRPPNRPPEIGPVRPLEVTDAAGPTPLQMPRPTDPDQDPLTVRVIGLPRSGEIRIEGNVARLNTVVSAERFQTATYKPDGKAIGSVGTFDVLIEDGRGGSITASLPITVRSSHHPPSVGPPGHLTISRQPMAIAAPKSPDGDPLTITVETLPAGVVLNSGAVVRVGDRLTVAELTNLTFMPDPGLTGPAGSLRYRVDNGHGDTVSSATDIEVTDPGRPKTIPNRAITQTENARAISQPPATDERQALIARLVAEAPVVIDRDSIARIYVDRPRSKALAISPEMKGSFQTGNWPNADAAGQSALEGCQIMYGQPCLLFAREDQVLSPPPSGEWHRGDMPRVKYAGSFDPAQIPRLREAVRSSPAVTGYMAAAQPKAMALHAVGQVSAVTGAKTQTAAQEQALAICNSDPERKAGDGPCYLYATGNQVVLPQRLTRPDPYTTIADAAALVRPAPGELERYASAAEKKALAIHVRTGQTFRWSGLETQDQADQFALEGCQQQYATPCVLLASGTELRTLDPRAAPPRDMERLHYRGRFDADKIPFLRISADLRSYWDLPGSKAIAVRPTGARAVIISGAASVAEAELRALVGCNADKSPFPCFIYASGNLVVLPDRRTEAQQ